MKRIVLVAAAIALFAASPAQAKSHHRHHHRAHRHHHRHAAGSRGLPWCGIYMGQLTGHHARRLWVAREWATEGVNAGGPGIDVIVVWPHHVGKIVGRDRQGRYVVLSGNDGGRVRSRARSLAGAIAFRRV